MNCVVRHGDGSIMMRVSFTVNCSNMVQENILYICSDSFYCKMFLFFLTSVMFLFLNSSHIFHTNCPEQRKLMSRDFLELLRTLCQTERIHVQIRAKVFTNLLPSPNVLCSSLRPPSPPMFHLIVPQTALPPPGNFETAWEERRTQSAVLSL